MQITVEILDTVAETYTSAGLDPARAAVEAFVLEAYRSHRATESQCRRMLGFDTRMQVHRFLADHDVPLHFSEEMLKQDLAEIDRLRQSWDEQAHAA